MTDLKGDVHVIPNALLSARMLLVSYQTINGY